jgi:hypothetical protein
MTLITSMPRLLPMLLLPPLSLLSLRGSFLMIQEPLAINITLS